MKRWSYREGGNEGTMEYKGLSKVSECWSIWISLGDGKGESRKKGGI